MTYLWWNYFFDHSGASRNIPSARFGNISMLPNELATITQPTKYKGVSFVIDMHSRTGFSGSPVFVYRTFGSDLTATFGSHFDDLEVEFNEIEIEPSRMGAMGGIRSQSFSGRLRGSRGKLRSNNLLRLLGIHWGQFDERWQIKQSSAETPYVKGMSGMSCVIPAWQILEVLNLPELKSRRDDRAQLADRDDFSIPTPESMEK
jgi:hypothetical protein